MNKFIPKGPYTYRRSEDGCDETFEIVSRTTGECVTSVHFWEAEEVAYAAAQWITASLNLGHAVTELMAFHQDDPSSANATSGITKSSIPNPIMRRDRADRFAKLIDRSVPRAVSLTNLLTDAQHWCDREFIDFDDAVVSATGTFHAETKAYEPPKKF